MSLQEQVQLFQSQKIRAVWDDEKEEWFFSVVDVVGVLTDSVNPTDYLKKMRKREPELGLYLGTNCPQVLMTTQTGRKRLTLAGTAEQIFRLIQSIPSKKAEPFKQWMAQVAALRISQLQDPELSIEQAIADYRRLGYNEEWINRRIKTIEIRKGLTDEWKRGGVTENKDFAFLTDLMSKTWSGMTTKEYKDLKGLKKQNLRDNMTNMELLLNALAEETATQISKERNPEGLGQNADVAIEGAEVAKGTREDIEKRLGRSVISSERAIDHTEPSGELPFNDKDNPEDTFFRLPGDLEE